MLNQFFIQSMFTQMKHNCDFVRFYVAAQLLSLKPSQAKEFFQDLCTTLTETGL